MNGPSLLEKMGRLYLETMPGNLADLETAIREGAADTVRSITHKLKSVAGTIGARSLAKLFNDLEANGSAMSPDEVDETLRQIKSEFERTAAALQRELIAA